MRGSGDTMMLSPRRMHAGRNDRVVRRIVCGESAMGDSVQEARWATEQAARGHTAQAAAPNRFAAPGIFGS